MTRSAQTKYRLFYLINSIPHRYREGIDSAWDYEIDRDKQQYTYMLARQNNNFDEVHILVSEVTITSGDSYKQCSESLYEWSKLPDRYLEMIDRYYHIRTDKGVVNIENYDNIVAYADMVQNLVESCYDIEVGLYGDFEVKLPLREKLNNYFNDITLSNDGNGYTVSCKSIDDSNYPKDLFTVKLNDISEIIHKAEAYDKLKESLKLFIDSY